MTLLQDSPERDYGDKLDRFNRFAETELRALVVGLGIRPTDRILDAGCGTGLITQWLAEQARDGHTLGIDLSNAHVDYAWRRAPANLPVAFEQGDITALDGAIEPFDWIFCSNTIHHLKAPVAAIEALLALLRPGGRLLLGRSAFLPDMFFAWDERLEEEVRRACYRYYRDKYGLSARDTTGTRNYVGWVKAAGGTDVASRTVAIERIAPLTPEDEAYFLEGVFRGYWGRRVERYLSPPDREEVRALTDPGSPRYCLRRPDFHHIQSYTLVQARRPA